MMIKNDDRICLIKDHSQRGKIIDVISQGVYEIVWDNGDIEILKGIDIQEEISTQSPWQKLTNNYFDDYRNFTISSIINKIRNSSANTISTLKASKTIFKPYQFIPLLKLLNSDNRRIIVADEVGLGKTISAGHIVLELAARGELNSLLVVCLNSIQEKWIDELQNKFNVRIQKFETITDFKTAISNSKNHNDKIFGVINYDKFRQKNNVEYFENNTIAFDLIIFDEVHTLRNDTNARKSLKSFTDLAKSIVMLTATPIMTSLENLYSLVKLLDEDNFSNYQVFQNEINLNKPFIHAYNQLNSSVKTNDIATILENAEVEEVFKYGDNEYKNKRMLNEVLGKNELYNSILKKLKTVVNPLTHKDKAEIQEQLINLNSINHFYTRTRKKQVLTEDSSVQRNPNVVEFSMNEEESEIYDAVMNQVDDNIGGIQIKRKFSSSLFAYSFKEEEYLQGIKEINFKDSKYNALLEVLKQQENNQLIVFAFFKMPLLYLKNRLTNDGFKVQLIYGGTDIYERNSIIEDFKNDKFQILLSSEVGSTGLDMQFCDRIVNYDLPWNPMVVEQRIGRIDRIGQKSPVINIFNFIYKDTIEEKIYHRLYDRINLFRESLGNLDEILGEKELYIEGEIEKIYKQQLSENELNELLDRIANAVEKNRIDLGKIGEGLKDSFSNDLYFENEIKNLEKNKLYLTEHDMLEFINRAIANVLTSITLVRDKTDEASYVLNQPTPTFIFDWVERYYDSDNSELSNVFRNFKTKNVGNKILLTFNQEYSFNNKNIEYISAYHPLVNAISNYFHKEKIDRNTVFRYALNINEVIDKDFLDSFAEGYYFLIKYEFEINKILNGRSSIFKHLKSYVLDLNGDEFIAVDSNKGEYFAAISQQYKTAIPENGIIEFNEKLTKIIKEKYSSQILNEKDELELNEKLKFESELDRKTKQEISDIDKRIERLNLNIFEGRGIENIQKSEISDLENKKYRLENLHNQSKLSVNSKLVSLNFIYLYG